METTMYEDARKNLKRPMSLDINASQLKSKVLKLGGPAVLDSPDMQMLKLASPELEKMIIAHGMVTTTPTPTKFICPQNVTEDQESYARGFVDALEKLHSAPITTTAAAGPQQTVQISDFLPMSVGGSAQPTFTTLTTLPGSVYSTQQHHVPHTSSTIVTQNNPQQLMVAPDNTVEMTTLPLSVAQADLNGLMPEKFNTITHSRVTALKEEPQTVPCMGSTPPMSPINMQDQEVQKLDRKRLRNREAARKCRTRKLERISRLEERVDDLKGQNSKLSTTASDLREQVAQLKQQILKHVNSGCQVMLNQNLM